MFKSRTNEKRRMVIKYLVERHRVRFNELKRDLDFMDGASLTYQLSSLEPLITQGKED
jgi:DNA-binding HxlR family transcriptional regulator